MPDLPANPPVSPRPAAAGLYAFGALAVLFALWRAASALAHYRAAAAMTDPSLRELEEVTAALDGAAALVAIAHAVAAFVLARRPVALNLRLLAASVVFFGLWAAAALLRLDLMAIPGLYPVGAIVAVFALCMILNPGVLAAYLGAVVGATSACFAALGEADPIVCAAVVVPCAAYALLGASGASALQRLRQRRYAR